MVRSTGAFPLLLLVLWAAAAAAAAPTTVAMAPRHAHQRGQRHSNDASGHGGGTHHGGRIPPLRDVGLGGGVVRQWFGGGEDDGSGVGGHLQAAGSASEASDQLNVTALECGVRRLALAFALRAQPGRPHRDTFDALRLGDLCGDVPAAGLGAPNQLPAADDAPLPPRALWGTRVLFVDGGGGSDRDGTGGLSRPYASVQRALVDARAVASGGGGNCTIVLRAGVVMLPAGANASGSGDVSGDVSGASGGMTIALESPLDDGLTIRSYPGERAWLSGGVSLGNVTFVPVSAADGMPAGAVKADLSSFAAFASGRANVSGLFTLVPHTRLTLARYPNGDAEVTDNRLSPALVSEWTKPPVLEPPAFQFVNLSDPNNPTGFFKNNSAMVEYNTWGVGSGGVCGTVWGPNASYWCGNNSAGGWAFVDQDAAKAGQLNIPVGLSYNPEDPSLERFKNWTVDGTRGALIHAWHSQSWFTNMFEIGSVDAAAGTIKFLRGGWQGGRNWCRCDQCPYAGGWCGQHKSPPENNDTRLIGGAWYAENVGQELDVPTEFWFNKQDATLYFFPNASKLPLTSTLGSNLVVPLLRTLVDVSAKNVTLRGLGFRDARKTFMDQQLWGTPSGGDWAQGRVGAVYLENSDGATLSNCVFRRVDGNAIFLSRRNRDTKIVDNDFSWIGDGAMASWGATDDTHGYDATAGNQPRNTLIEGNYFRELGIYEKQSSPWGQAKTCQTTLRGNIAFNIPRAGFNFNDNLGGGNVVDANLLFNTCRESGDHGPINTWDREPFLTEVATGEPSFIPAPNNVTNNFIIANYGASQGIDNDDGSSFWHITRRDDSVQPDPRFGNGHGNVFYSADGFKQDYGGHSSKFNDNLVIGQPGGFDGQNCINVGSFLPGQGDMFHNNTCVVLGCRSPSCVDQVVTQAQCDASVVGTASNSYYTMHGNASISCDRKVISIPEAQAKYGLETGSTFGTVPDAVTLISWAAAWLDLPTPPPE